MLLLGADRKSTANSQHDVDKSIRSTARFAERRSLTRERIKRSNSTPPRKHISKFNRAALLRGNPHFEEPGYRKSRTAAGKLHDCPLKPIVSVPISCPRGELSRCNSKMPFGRSPRVIP